MYKAEGIMGFCYNMEVACENWIDTVYCASVCTRDDDSKLIPQQFDHVSAAPMEAFLNYCSFFTHQVKVKMEVCLHSSLPFLNS